MERRNLFEGVSPLAKLLLGAGIAVLSFTVFFVISIIIAVPLYGISLWELNTISDVSNPANIPIIKYLQIVQSIGLFVLPPFLIAFLFNINVFAYLKLDKAPYLPSILLVIIIVVVALPFINWIAYLNSEIHLPAFMQGVEDWMRKTEAEAMQLTEALVAAYSFDVYLVNLLMIAVLPALGEELFFRGIIQRLFGEITRSHHAAIWITAILFSALHFQFLGFFPRVLLGVFFGYLLQWSGTIWLPIAAHFVNNAFAVTVYYLMNINMVEQNIDDVGTTFSALTIIANIAVLSALLFVMYQIEIQKKKRNAMDTSLN